jgi:prefoldin subunit 5
MTGEEMERAIEFLLQNQATLEQRVEQTQAQLAELT